MAYFRESSSKVVGTVLVDWAFSYNHLGLAKATAINQNFRHVDDLDRLGDFFEKAVAEDITTAGLCALCIERHIDGLTPAISDEAREALLTGNFQQVPVMIAYTDLEGVIYSSEFLDQIDTMNNNFAALLPHDLVFPIETQRQEAAQRVKSIHFGNTLVTVDTPRGYIDFKTDTVLQWRV